MTSTEATTLDTVQVQHVAPAELARRNPLFEGLAGLFEPLRHHGAAALEFGGVPLHPGALRAYRDAGLLT